MAAAVTPAAPMGQWTTGLFGCMADLKSCCCVLWCPCVVEGRIANIVSDGFTSKMQGCCIFFWLMTCLGLQCCYTCGFRQRLRQKYSLPAKPCGDFCTHFWCLGCALCQEYRELQNRGWEPRDGFQANVQRMHGTQPAIVPPVQQKM